ncbi:hypothetical protein [Geoanaerobacter pelophilus]|uniref:hypothetical protein n=1 Tax=Geoanaerobacter pelophilus TaxID=60036 RepID=UPI00117BD183|nr:hypothetical protein [Geoanaerobacter pelophilus]
MPSRISIPSIINATLTGIKNAQTQYQVWTGGNWLWQAPEYLITTNIAANISGIKGSKYITLENGASEAIEDAGAKGRGRLPTDFREAGRVDILLWWADNTPRAIIEVKNQISGTDQYHHDLKRISSFLKRKPDVSSLQFGLFAFYDSAYDGARKPAERKVEDKIASIHAHAKSVVGKGFSTKLYKSETHREENSAWTAACLFIKPSVL